LPKIVEKLVSVSDQFYMQSVSYLRYLHSFEDNAQYFW